MIRETIQNKTLLKCLLMVGMTFGLAVVPLLASSKNAGTSGAAFLKINPGARPAAMGEAFAAVVDDANALTYNPAGLGLMKDHELTGTHAQWFQGFNYDYGAYVMETSVGGFGFSAATLKSDEITKYAADESSQGAFDSLDSAYTLSFGQKWGTRFSYGLTARYVSQKLDNASAASWNGDAGILLNPISGDKTSIGLAGRNIGQSVTFVSESDPPPTLYDLGLARPFFNDRLLATADMVYPRDNSLYYAVGAEYRLRLMREAKLAFRGGYNAGRADSGSSTGLSLGAGFAFKSFLLDAAWVPLGDLGNTFRYTATLHF